MEKPAILAVGRAFPPHYATQAELTRAFRKLWPEGDATGERLEPLHRAATVRGRYLARPLEELAVHQSFAEANRTFIRVGTDIGERAIRDALTRARVRPDEVDYLYTVTVTGLATPSLDATLVNRLGMRGDVKRVPIFGLGCSGGAAALGRIADLLQSTPRAVAVLAAIELCTVTVQREDLSMTNAVATGIFGDGAAAVVLCGGERASHLLARGAPRALDSAASLLPQTEEVMGWQFLDSGFKVVLSPEVPAVVERSIADAVDPFLARHGLSRRDISHWICHPGGPKVLQALERALTLPPKALATSWRSLSSVGNISSASVLLILGDTLDEVRPSPGELGVVAAMGPGFGAELVLLRW